MDAERKSKKVNISVPIELLERIDEYADDNYISRTAVFCMATDQFLAGKEMQKTFKELGKLLKKVTDMNVDDDEFKDRLEELGDFCSMMSGQYVIPPFGKE